jgi:aerobic-type carbon monoxide dehydrogenase small subunit (CoxS/CutS family)
MPELHTLHVEVNGRPQQRSVQPRQHLVDFVRNELGLKGSHLGCEHGVCGACTVEVDGRIVRGCLTLAVQTQGCKVRTIEGLSEDGDVRDLVTYQLVERLVRSMLRAEAIQYQFQLRLVPPRSEPDESMAVVTSPVQNA